VTTPSAADLSTIELLVLNDAGGQNDLGNAYGGVQLYATFERREELLDAVESAILRLFDLGLIRLFEAPAEVGYRVDHNELPAMTRAQLVAELERERDPTDVDRDTMIFCDPTPAGELVLESVPDGQIPQVSGAVRRPWLE
jgi:hypothetical protein